MDAFQKEIRKWAKDEMRRYKILPCHKQLLRILKSGLFELKPTRGGMILVPKKESKFRG